MIRNLEITGFRRFQRFEMSGLGRVNLLVGPNNSGKTTILEAIEILTSRGHLDGVWAATRRRGEQLWDDAGQHSKPEVDVCHLFNGHILERGRSFKIATDREDDLGSVTVQIVKLSLDDEVQRLLVQASDDEAGMSPNALHLDWIGARPVDVEIPLTLRGGVTRDWVRRYPSTIDESIRGRGRQGLQFVTTSSLELSSIVTAFEGIVLTPDEDLVIEALNIIEPEIERIAPVGTQKRLGSSQRSGIVAKMTGGHGPVPIGSLGEGIWRMLGLTLALARAKDGILLVDEIDTGLHYTVLADMWKLISETAHRLDIQVFATTHSRDACESLATLARNASPSANDVTIQRIEPGKQRAVAFNAKEIVIAAKRGIEVR